MGKDLQDLSRTR